MNNKVTFPELVEQVAQYANTSKRMSELFLKELFATISQSLIDGESVKVKGIGTFKLTEVSPRKSVDVNTGEEIEIPGHKKLSFAPDKDMAEAINQPFMHFETEILDDDVTDDQLAAIDAGVSTEAPAEATPVEEDADDSAAAEAPAAEAPVAAEEEVVMPPVFVAPVEEPESEEAETEAEAPVEPSEEVPAEAGAPAEVPVQEPADEPEEAVSEEEAEIEEEAEPEPVTEVEPSAVAEPEDEAEDTEAEGEPDAESEMVSEELADERVGQEIDKRRITRRSLLEGFVVGVVTTLIVTLFAYRLYLMKGYEATPADEEPFTEHVATDSVVASEQALAENSTEADADKQKADEEQKKAEEEKKKAEEEKQKAEAAKPTTASVAAGTTDTIKPGTNLYRMSRKHYGSDKFWVYIYEENKAKYPNPNTIPVGAVLHIPQLEKYGAKAGDPASIAAAKKKQGEIFNHLNKKK
ncbi:MAG: HU family DNA-binding protein [Bacteroidales bacterium]|nr:HU family DNA-binding protein [Bacteroidales bacterium]